MKLFAVFLLFLVQNASAQIRDFYRHAVNSTVLLYKQVNDGTLEFHGTGFIMYNYSSTESILLTCKHLTYHDTLVAAIPAADSIRLALTKTNLTHIPYRAEFGPQTLDFDGSNFLIKIPLKENINFFRHPYLDISVIYFPQFSKILDSSGNTIRLMDLKALPKSFLSSKDDIYAGEDVIFIGFPDGIGTKTGFKKQLIFKDRKTNPLIRKGMVSWVSESSTEYLLDGFSFGGNSGSPVFSIPELSQNSKFVGMITGHLNEEFLIDHFSIDTARKQMNVSSQELDVNKGLARFIPSMFIEDFVNETVEKRKTATKLKNMPTSK